MAVISESCGCREVVRKSLPHTTHIFFLLLFFVLSALPCLNIEYGLSFCLFFFLTK